LALNGLRISEALGADIDQLGLERGPRTLLVHCKGGKSVSIPLAPRTARALVAELDAGVEGGQRRRGSGGQWGAIRLVIPVQEAASRADPRTTMRYDRARQSLCRSQREPSDLHRRARVSSQDALNLLARWSATTDGNEQHPSTDDAQQAEPASIEPPH